MKILVLCADNFSIENESSNKIGDYMYSSSKNDYYFVGLSIDKKNLRKNVFIENISTFLPKYKNFFDVIINEFCPLSILDITTMSLIVKAMKPFGTYVSTVKELNSNFFNYDREIQVKIPIYWYNKTVMFKMPFYLFKLKDEEIIYKLKDEAIDKAIDIKFEFFKNLAVLEKFSKDEIKDIYYIKDGKPPVYKSLEEYNITENTKKIVYNHINSEIKKLSIVN